MSNISEVGKMPKVIYNKKTKTHIYIQDELCNCPYKRQNVEGFCHECPYIDYDEEEDFLDELDPEEYYKLCEEEERERDKEVGNE